MKYIDNNLAIIILLASGLSSLAFIRAGSVIVKSTPEQSRVVGTSPVILNRHPSENAAIPGINRHIQYPYSIWR
jgi:hypothetical protein